MYTCLLLFVGTSKDISQFKESSQEGLSSHNYEERKSSFNRVKFDL